MTRSRLRAASGGLGFVIVGGPTLVAGLVPWLMTRWHADDQLLSLKLLGRAFIAFGLLLVLEATARFALQGRGTPAPWAPPERFVARGSYRFTRNPMYVGVLALIVGQALLLGRPILLAYAAVFWAVVAAFVRLYEEPTLTERYGEQYADYRRTVPGWWPRLRRER